MKKIFSLSLIATAGLLLTASCNSFLDMTPTDRVSEKTIWAQTASAEYSINYIYTYLWDYASAPTSLGLTESLTDEMKYTSYNYNALCYIPSEMAYGGSVITAGYVDVYLGYWGSLYTAIRRANEGLSFLGRYGQMSDADKTRLEAELRFLRGYLYFELVKRYREVIIYDEDLTAITRDKALSTETAGWDFIENDLDFAAANLPEASSANGRLNKGQAYALLSRAMLYAGRYDAVIAAADSVTALGYDLEDSYKDAWSKSISDGNREAILQYVFNYEKGITHSFNFYYTPGGDYSIKDMVGGGYGVPTQEMVESYELATGGYPDWTAWHTSDGTTATPPYESLEPRFKATILYNGSSWKGRTIEPFVDGTDGWAQWKAVKEPKGKTVTGYYLRKLVDESYDVTTSGSSQPFTLIRYAEVLLNKAEACLRKTSPDEASANGIISMVRERVGLPWTDKFGSELLSALKQERKVELAYEGLRYWDLRRWGDASKDYPTGLASYQQHGFKIEKDESGDFVYTYVSVDEKDRTFTEKLSRFPMPESELESNSLVDQYPEWK